MAGHIPCEHCEEVRLEAEDRAFGEALRGALAEPKNSFSRRIAEAYMEDLYAAPLPSTFIDGPVTFKFWSDLQ